MIQGILAEPHSANRAVCYCLDCQAFAHFLGRADEILDERGGSDVVQTLPKHVTIDQGAGSLVCIRLTPNGLLRWYADCCRTPIGNTLATPKFSFVGLLHSCLDQDGPPLDEAFGRVRTRVHTAGARGEPKPHAVGRGTMIATVAARALQARLNGDYRRTPFFRAGTGEPVGTPRVLTAEEFASAMDQARAFSACGPSSGPR